MIKSRKKRQNLTKIRISAHKLEIEIGRYTRPPVIASERYCKICNKSEVEDEKHFLLSCEKYSEQRNTFLNEVYIEYPFTKNLCKDELFKWLMFFQESTICHNLASFINKAHSIRQNILDNHAVKDYGKRKANSIFPNKNKIKRIKIQ